MYLIQLRALKQDLSST